MTKWHLPYRGRTWVFDEDRITASEARTQKRLTIGPGLPSGMAPREADRARRDLDGDAMHAALVIAIQRAGEGHLLAEPIDLDDLVLTDVLDATVDAVGVELAAAQAARQEDGEGPAPEGDPLADAPAEPTRT